MSAATIGSDWIGRIIDGRISLLRWLGGAGTGGVFFTQFGEPPENAAVKLIPVATPNAESLLAQWRARTRLSHPHLMRLFHAGRSNVEVCDLLYAVTEYSEETPRFCILHLRKQAPTLRLWKHFRKRASGRHPSYIGGIRHRTVIHRKRIFLYFRNLSA